MGVNSMEHRRQQAIVQGADKGVIHRLFDSKEALARNAKRTPGQKAFVKWMTDRGRDPQATTAMDVMNFLAHGLDKLKWKPSTAKAYKSAILQLFPPAGRTTISDNDLFQLFLKQMNSDSFKRMHNANIDLTPIMSYLHGLGDNFQLDITDLTAKTCFLLATCGFLRPDDLACTDAAQCSIKDNTLTLVVMFPKERRSQERIIKPVQIKSHPIEALCPVKAFVEYRRRTAMKDHSARAVHHKVDTVEYTPLIRDVRTGSRGLSNERISKYIDMVMTHMPREIGQPKFKARAVGASAALLKGIPVDDVTTQGNWSSPTIVEGFYRLSRAVHNDFTATILS